MTKGACTPLYAAPEVLKLEQYDQKCDVWSAGLILYEMLVGKEMFAHVKTKAQLMSEIDKFKSPNKQINYPKELHPIWEKITLSMLTYSKTDRPGFDKLLADFEKQSLQIEKDLASKYGYDMPDFDDGLKITKTLSPYQSRPNKDGKVDMTKKAKRVKILQQHQRSSKMAHILQNEKRYANKAYQIIYCKRLRHSKERI